MAKNEKLAVVSKLMIKMDINKVSEQKAVAANKDGKDQKPAEEEMQFSEKIEKPNLTTFSYKILDMPELKYSPAKETVKRPPTSEYPYFTDTAKFPANLLDKNKQEILNFFFNKTVFETTMKNEGTNWVDTEEQIEEKEKKTDKNKAKGKEEKKAGGGKKRRILKKDEKERVIDPNDDKQKENEKYNVMMTLNCLLGINPRFNRSIVSTYDVYVKQRSPDYWNVGILESINLFGLLEKVNILKADRGVRLKLDGGLKLIADVKWTNDVVRHPDYQYFLRTFNKEVSNLKANSYNVTKAFQAERKLFVDKLDIMKDANDAFKFIIDNTKTPQNNNNNAQNVTNLYLNAPRAVKRTVTGDKLEKTMYSDHYKYYILSGMTDAEFKKLVDNDTDINADKKEDLNKKFKTFKSTKTIKTYYYTLLYSIDPLFISSRELSESKRTSTQKVAEYLNQIPDEVGSTDEAIMQIVTNLINVAIVLESSSDAVGYQDHKELFTKDDIANKNFSLMTLAARLTALNNIRNFVNKGITMNTGDTRVDGTKKSAVEIKADDFAKTKFNSIYKSSEDIGKALADICTLKRTSNKYLYGIIENTKNGTWNVGDKDNVNQQITTAKELEQQQQAFSLIHRKYILGEPLNVDIYEIRNSLYTGVDTYLQTADKTEAGTKEICVYMNVVDDETAKKMKNAKCVHRDDSLLNRLKYLMMFNTDELMNTFRDYRLASKYLAPPEEKPDNKKDKKTGGKKTRKNRNLGKVPERSSWTTFGKKTRKQRRT